jgi:hypothetical protein
MTFTLQYISDIHLEFRAQPFNLNPVAKNLALCGDIGYLGSQRYQSFIKDCAEKFENVFVIFGNHEFYNLLGENKTMGQKIEVAQELENVLPNVWFLNNRSVFVNVRNNHVSTELTKHVSEHPYTLQIIGSTLWSNIESHLGEILNDYKNIYINPDTLITTDWVQQQFQSNVNYIVQQLERYPFIAAIVLTHHGPHPICNGAYDETSLASAYTSLIPELYKKIICWLVSPVTLIPVFKNQLGLFLIIILILTTVYNFLAINMVIQEKTQSP